MLCYVRGFKSHLAERVHDLIEIKPYSFTLSWRLICHQDNASSTSVLRTSRQMCMGYFHGFAQISVGCQMGKNWISQE